VIAAEDDWARLFFMVLVILWLIVLVGVAIGYILLRRTAVFLAATTLFIWAVIIGAFMSLLSFLLCVLLSHDDVTL